MSISRVNNGGFGSRFLASSGTMSGSIGFTPTVGNKLIAAVSHSESGTITLEQAGVAWTLVTETSLSTGRQGNEAQLWLGDVVGPTTSDVIDIPFTSSDTEEHIAICVHEVSGLREIWPFDEESTTTNIIANDFAFSGSAGLNNFDDAYFFAFYTNNEASATSEPTAPVLNGFVEVESQRGTDPNTSDAHRCVTAEKIVTSKEFCETRWGLDPSAWPRIVCTSSIFTSEGDTPPTQLVQQKEAQVVASSSLQVVLDNHPTEGNALLLSLSASQALGVITLTQTGVNWVLAAQQASTSVETRIYYAVPTGGTISDTLDISWSLSRDVVASLQEYSGVVVPVLVDQTQTSSGTNDPMTSGVTAALTESNQLVFASFAHQTVTAKIQKTPGFLRTHHVDTGTMVAASFRFDRALKPNTYECQAEANASGDWAGAVVTFKTTSGAVQSGDLVSFYTAEAHQDGTETTVDIGSPNADLATIPAATLTNGEKHVAFLTTRFRGNLDGYSRVLSVIGGSTERNAEVWPLYRAPEARGEMFGDIQIGMEAGEEVKIRAEYISNQAVDYKQTNIVAMSLDKLAENNDWLYREDTTLLSQMSNNFADNVGAQLRIRADGDSTYLVIANGVLVTVGSITAVNADMAIQLWDHSNSAELARAGWQKEEAAGSRRRSMNIMAVVKPPVGIHRYQVRCIGGGLPSNQSWDHESSRIFVLKISRFASWSFDQNLSLDQVAERLQFTPSPEPAQPSGGFVYLPDETKRMVSFVFTQIDATSNELVGIGTKATFPDVGSDRSIWDTDDTVNGGLVTPENTHCGSNLSGNDFTRIPTFAASVRNASRREQGTVQLYNVRENNVAEPVINRYSIVTIGALLNPPDSQSPAPTPTLPPELQSSLTEKEDGVHVEEGLSNLIEQFKG